MVLIRRDFRLLSAGYRNGLCGAIVRRYRESSFHQILKPLRQVSSMGL